MRICSCCTRSQTTASPLGMALQASSSAVISSAKVPTKLGKAMSTWRGASMLQVVSLSPKIACSMTEQFTTSGSLCTLVATIIRSLILSVSLETTKSSCASFRSSMDIAAQSSSMRRNRDSVPLTSSGRRTVPSPRSRLRKSEIHLQSNLCRSETAAK